MPQPDSPKNVQKEFRSPNKSKVAKRKQVTNITTMPVLNEALNIMRSVQTEKDEYTLFGQQVAIKLRKIASPHARFTIQNIINKALFDGEIGMYDIPQHNNTNTQVLTSTAYPSYANSTPSTSLQYFSTTPSPSFSVSSGQSSYDDLLQL